MTSEMSTGEDGQRVREASQLVCSLVIQLICLQFGDSVK